MVAKVPTESEEKSTSFRLMSARDPKVECVKLSLRRIDQVWASI